MSPEKRIRLGDLLIQQKVISDEQLVQALEQQKQKQVRWKLGRILVANHFATEEHISEALAKQFNIPYIADLGKYDLKPEVVRLMPESQARQYHAIILEDRGNGFLVGLTDPTDASAIEEIQRILRKNVEFVVVTEGQLLEGIDRGYWRTQEKTGLN